MAPKTNYASDNWQRYRLEQTSIMLDNLVLLEYMQPDVLQTANKLLQLAIASVFDLARRRGGWTLDLDNMGSPTFS